MKKGEKTKDFILTSRTKRWIKAILMFLSALVIGLSFWNKAGSAGRIFINASRFLIGEAFFTIPLFLFLGGLIFLKSRKRSRVLAMFLAIIVSIIGISGILASQDLVKMQGGWAGYLMAKLLVGFFGFLVANIVFGAIILIGLFIFLQFIWSEIPKEKKEEEKKPAFVLNRQDAESLRVKGGEEEKLEKTKIISSGISLFKKGKDEKEKEKIKDKKPGILSKGNYILPPLDLLSKDELAPTSGNIKENSMLIKNTLENFGIPVEMTEVNIGPTVTQYAFKPAEGVKLSKITTLSNNLALALAAHPIRIEAPIPGKSLVGIEVPNKVRSTVVLRNLINHANYQNVATPLLITLGRNVSGSPVYADLTEMPHLLVAGATGTGKTIFLNTLILSLLYKCTPDNLRMIMVDPKRVEFQNYNDIPHLLCPVIYDANKTINALQWLTREMERRFEIFSEIPTRNIGTYNQNKSVVNSGLQLPYIVFIVDELADLMAAKGREIEAGVVRLAQMARATGIHLVLATQRPSVEVITGLIKANITSRVTFQVASQIDSRTVLDTAGAEKLLGSGDMLFVSAKSAKIRRIQGPYISEKEVNKVAEFIAEQSKKIEEPQLVLVQNLKDALSQQDAKDSRSEIFFGDNDPLFEDVKRIILETQKASASFLQRRLRIGYSRAARLIDMLEEKGIVGPADGAKPREVYAQKADMQFGPDKKPSELDESEQGNEWQKV
ncbi:MAG: DNA segregation ATPase FtsK/SpoIIIE, S-DNA-T family [Parcubacteria group bacterium Licking1014_1]|nr:MAG: DNA segregation ATPase FtsK/SpoIIIE, S-DNA-T family [Parcubacteria group bacterium Licking1014_1]